MKKLLPILLVLFGTGAGVAAGIFLRPQQPPLEVVDGNGELTGADPEEVKSNGDIGANNQTEESYEYVKMSNQFVVPLVTGNTVTSLVVLSLTLEVLSGTQESVYSKEPKIRDTFLQVMFDHANIGGFDGEFTDFENLGSLRRTLRKAARKISGDSISDVLIQEIARQDY